jgi:hypothetical protein
VLILNRNKNIIYNQLSYDKSVLEVNNYLMQHLQPNTTLQGGKYRIERVLGQGVLGITYLAVHTLLQR